MYVCVNNKSYIFSKQDGAFMDPIAASLPYLVFVPAPLMLPGTPHYF